MLGNWVSDTDDAAGAFPTPIATAALTALLHASVAEEEGGGAVGSDAALAECPRSRL